MSFTLTCGCGQAYTLQEAAIGKLLTCKVCGRKTPVTKPDDDLEFGVDAVRRAMEDLDVPRVPPPPLPEQPKHKEYKVLTQKDKWFSGKFDPEKLEGAINAYAKQGWIVKGIATAAIPTLTGTRDEMIVVMER